MLTMVKGRLSSHCVQAEGVSLRTCVVLSLCGLCLSLRPPDCRWSLEEAVDRLNCVVEPGQHLLVEEEVFGVGPEQAKALWVTCADASEPFVLSHGVFMAVPNLRDLRLQNCRVAGITPGALSYLPYLQNLTLRAHTSLNAWTPPPPGSSQLALDVKSGVFRGLPELRQLDLSTTSLMALPSDFLCFLPALRHLNLTSCGLRDFRSIGILPPDPTNPATSCGTHITRLDLSANHFTLLPPATFMALKHLVQLRLDANSITLAAERALLGLNQLELLSLAGNQLTSLPPEFFKDNNLLREIYLQNNSIDVLAPGLFSGLNKLENLDLATNDLSSDWVNGDTFRGLLRLNYLNLGYNRLTKVDAVLFRDLYSLQILNLENNRIHHLSEDALAGMYNLHTLILSHNHLKSLDERICNGLFLLSYLIIDNNRIESIGGDSFRNCSNVEDLNLSGNKLKVLPEAITHLSLLRTLDLGENQLTGIGNVSYEWKYLYGLRLTGNKIERVSKDAFIRLISLKIVNLAENNISSLEAGTFDSNPNLHAVRLDVNRLQNISGLFRNIPNLLWLNISGNLLSHLDYDQIPPRLQLLNLQSNKITSLGTTLNLQYNRIRTLDLSQNFLTEISTSNLPDSIEKLILNNNQISNIQPYTFFRKPNLTWVDLSHNRLVKLDQNALRLSPSGRGKTSARVEILIGHNPLQCDCTMEWLQSINSRQDDDTGHYPVILDSSEIQCSLSFDRTLDTMPVKVTPSQFLCKYESHCFSSCHCCDFDACDCEMSCPDNCSCYHDQGWSLNVVDCSMMEKTQIPGRIPMDVSQLFLDGNVFPSLDSHAFIGRKNLRTLFLNGSHVEVLQNRTFHGLRQLRILHLENNFIERLDGFEFDELESLEEIYLQQNSLSWISNETFSHLTRLRLLWLHGNNFVDLPIWRVTTGVGRLSRTLSDITLRGNEWSCDCAFTTVMKDWLVEYRAKISDVNQIHCVDSASTSSNDNVRTSNGGGDPHVIVVRLLDQRNQRCSTTSTDLSVLEPSTTDHSNWTDYAPFIISAVVLLFLSFLFCGLSFYWRQSLRVWFHAKCGLRLDSCRGEPMAERDKLFDAFVSYSSKDEAWVRQVLAPELERHDPPYRICLRYRDLPTGGTYLADTIVQASEASRRTVLVLSHHFLKGEWSRSDVKSAHHSVLKDRNRKVVIILLGDLPSKDLDPDIRLYLKQHTYVSCDDKRFWDKLYYALPDVKVKVAISRCIPSRGSSRSQSHSIPTYHHQQQPQTPPPLPQSNPPQVHHLHHIPSTHKQPNRTATTTMMCTNTGNTHTLLPSSHNGPPLPPLRLPNANGGNSANPNRHVAIHI